MIPPCRSEHRKRIEEYCYKNSNWIPCPVENIDHRQYNENNLVATKYDNVWPREIFHGASIPELVFF